ncbi:hypothetical protein K1T71_002082 [Dendrolimus kikuchii]|uniref:Uncharacterized protein n=1 Tax=Dendrolimus kikuchii TaxID=765133 RepID=A0ACC1DGC4_9NEOP|nr:hypothetical protein K1T71_002082 [Dendrolimus kikuchii]
MTRFLSICLALCAVINTSYGISSKVDFEDEGSSTILTNSSKSDDEDVEVKHTIVVSTKLKNNNRRGIHRSTDEQGTLTYNLGHRDVTNKEDSDEVPVINGYKAVETTHIRSPDTRHKTQMYPESVIINRNIRDEYDIYPNLASNPLQWKPSSFYNNINSWSNDFGTNLPRERPYQNPVKIHRRITDNNLSEFYCKRCRELTNSQGIVGCIQPRNAWKLETTTQKMKLDGKLAKLN